MRKWVWLPVSFFFRILPLSWIRPTVECLARWSALLPLSYKPAVEANRKRFGLPLEKNSLQLVARSFLWYLAEFFAFHRVSVLQVTLEGEDYLRRMLSGTKGAIIVSGHIGNWELGAQILSRYGFKMSAVALRFESRLIDSVFDRQRAREAVHIIPLGRDARKEALKALKNGRCLGIVGDRDFSGHVHRVRFGSGIIRFPTGPAHLSLQSGAPLVPMFLLREGLWKFRLCIGQPIIPSEYRDNKNAVTQIVEAFAHQFESIVYRFPEQWLVFESVVEEP